jgi:3-hydroxyisobutyrate dehydrogenase
MIALFGTGLLGSGFVRALRRRGEEVNVWNRTATKAQALEASGARAYADPSDAARGATRVHLTLSDDVAVDEVLERARAGFGAGVVIVDHTTTSVGGVAARVKRWSERGVPFQHAPLFMGPQNALDSTGIMLLSGDRALVDHLSPDLEKMTGRLVYLGPQPERAAAFKLLGNLFIMLLTSGVTEMLALAKALSIPGSEAATLFDFFNPGTSIPSRVNRILAADFAHPSWELSMARKDARLMLEEAQGAGQTLAVLPALASEMDRLIARGHGQDDWLVIAKYAL